MSDHPNFHAGQEVEVAGYEDGITAWVKAKIIAQELHRGALGVPTRSWIVEFTNKKRGLFDADHIRQVSP